VGGRARGWRPRGWTLTTDNAFNVALTLYDATGAVVLSAKEGSSRNFHWYNDLISWDTVTQTLQWFLDGASSSNLFDVTWSSSNPVGYSSLDSWQVGSTTSVDVGFSELWFNVPGAFYDLTFAANVAAFTTGALTMTGDPCSIPVSLGPNGMGPTGSAPHIYLSGAGNAFATNKGTAGGSWTISGTLSDALNNP
jgi:hypothetical protein